MDTVAVNGVTIARMVDFLTRARRSSEEARGAQARKGKCASPYRGKVDELESGRVKAPVKRETQDDDPMSMVEFKSVELRGAGWGDELCYS